VVEPGGVGEALGVRHVEEEMQRFHLHEDKGLIKTLNSVKRMLGAHCGWLNSRSKNQTRFWNRRVRRRRW
jgi:hypothetical protein